MSIVCPELIALLAAVADAPRNPIIVVIIMISCIITIVVIFMISIIVLIHTHIILSS